uniref:Uncharacterized protein n=1 Tax=Vespula pensylvanica TaxID=30213 RepID=A0A834NGX9_VESPE|nr:hypothetical protein H0235_014669 [Vespula pensylvanica]
MMGGRKKESTEYADVVDAEKSDASALIDRRNNVVRPVFSVYRTRIVKTVDELATNKAAAFLPGFHLSHRANQCSVLRSSLTCSAIVVIVEEEKKKEYKSEGWLTLKEQPP